MKFLIYLICFLPALLLDAFIQENISSIMYSFFPTGDAYEIAGLSGLIAGAVKIMLYAPAYYVAKKWIEHRANKKESQLEINISKILKICVIALASLILFSCLITLLQSDSVELANFITMFCDTLIVVGLVMALVSVVISAKYADARSVLRMAGIAVLAIGLTVFYLYAKLHNI